MTGAALALPIAVEIFRMAYYATLLPNTALAKEASRSYWKQGWQYLHNFAAPYLLYLPFVLVACVVAVILSDRWMRGPAWRAVMIAPVAAALIHALYVVRLGGDFMHARFLLPAFFVLMLPLAVLPLRPLSVGVVVVVLLWAIPVAGWMRVKQVDAFIADERHVWMMVSGHENPVNIKDYAKTFPAYTGSLAGYLEKNGYRNLVTHSGGFPTAPDEFPGFRLLSLDPSIPHKIVIEGGPLGLSAYSAPTDVYVEDELGLGDVIAARLKMPQHGRPGHEKVLPESWVLARFAPPGVSAPDVSASDIDAARTALACPPLQELMRRTSGALSVGDLFGNFFAAPRLTRLRFPQDPTAAAFKLCKR